MTIEQKFIDSLKEYYSNYRRNSQFYNRIISEKKFLMVHPILLPNSKIDVLINFTNENKVVYPMGEDLQHEVFEFVRNSDGHHYFFSTGFSEDEMIEFLPETRYIETSLFTPIELVNPTWDDLLNAQKVGDANFNILKETFNEFHSISDFDDRGDDSDNLFYEEENKPSELELRIVFEDITSDHKYGSGTILVFWKGEFTALCNEYIERYRQDHSYYIANVDNWREMMKVLYEKANIKPGSPIHGAEILDMTNDVEQMASIPGFTEKVHTGD
jgi:hypothetical protein